MITVSGTLKEFEWTNPHCWLHVAVVDPASGRTLDWAFEMGSVGQVAAQGWKADAVKPGDKITIEAHPMKDGSRGGQYQAAKLSDGREFLLSQLPNGLSLRVDAHSAAPIFRMQTENKAVLMKKVGAIGSEDFRATVSTISVSWSQRPIESPRRVGHRSSAPGCFLPSVWMWRT